ncbi:MAG: hypothetical protein E7157_02370 [Lactobacillales bacterium]|nr:hypothetical protein [Lactobacillales bacterium]
MKKLNHRKRIFIITLILCVFSLLSTIVLYMIINNTKVNYKKIECIVSNVTIKRNYGKTNRGNRYDYIVTVLYNNKKYKLNNVYDSNINKYDEGVLVKAYLSKDQLYANEEGVKTSSSISNLYFVFLFVTIGMFIVCLVIGTNYKKEKNIDIQIKNQLKN